jgi:hypothetical protein
MPLSYTLRSRGQPCGVTLRNSGGLRYGFSCSHRDCSTARVLADNADRQTKKGAEAPRLIRTTR